MIGDQMKKYIALAVMFVSCVAGATEINDSLRGGGTINGNLGVCTSGTQNGKFEVRGLGPSGYCVYFATCTDASPQTRTFMTDTGEFTLFKLGKQVQINPNYQSNNTKVQFKVDADMEVWFTIGNTSWLQFNASTTTINNVPKFAGTNTTGAGNAALGTSNCPAATPTAVYTWIKAVAADGSTVYIPCWK